MVASLFKVRFLRDTQKKNKFINVKVTKNKRIYINGVFQNLRRLEMTGIRMNVQGRDKIGNKLRTAEYIVHQQYQRVRSCRRAM